MSGHLKTAGGLAFWTGELKLIDKDRAFENNPLTIEAKLYNREIEKARREYEANRMA